MATNLAPDQDLLERAFRVSGEPTKKAAVTRALQENMSSSDCGLRTGKSKTI